MQNSDTGTPVQDHMRASSQSVANDDQVRAHNLTHVHRAMRGYGGPTGVAAGGYGHASPIVLASTTKSYASSAIPVVRRHDGSPTP